MSGERPAAVSDVAMLAVIGIAVGIGAAVWVWGGVAGAAFGSGWPRLSFGQVLGVIVRLPGRLTDPATAWPRSARPELPGAGGFYLA
ncbi:MAG: hypothetical protein WAK93_05445, partial [Solirubrobacteraceae bacterium]